ncbi:MAG TPA: hypothetical protein VHC97_24195 [Thermoanaerobaculia bacterium]|jgi:hypothetical protein|nr:hypothetical protein [Thermoanaerobaculia bacterium]
MSIPFRRGALLLALAAISIALPARALEDSRTWREVKTFTAGGGPRVLELDGFRGNVIAMGTGATAARGDAVEIVVHEKVTGRSKEEIDEARRQVTVDLSQQGNRVKVYVDGPFRCHDRENDRERCRNCTCGDRDGDRVSQRVTHDFELRIPAGTEIDLGTVLGDVRVEGTDGAFEVSSVNGKVEMAGVRGAGTAISVNGPVKVTFAANPNGNCRFQTVNGEVDVAFLPGLDADLSFKTLNGEVYTDFPYKMRSLATPAGDRKDGRFVLRKAGTFGITIGSGGPNLAFDTINGDILVRNQDR